MSRTDRASKGKRHPPKAQSAHDPQLKRGSKHLATLALGVLLLASLIGSIVVTSIDDKNDAMQFDVYTSRAKTTIVQAKHQFTTDGPRTLDELLALPPDELEGLDIGLVNLICAQGTPGGEDLTPMRIDELLAMLDDWAEKVHEVTERHLYRVHSPDPRYQKAYEGSEAKFRAIMLCQVLQEDLGVHYHEGFSRVGNPELRNSKDCFIHGQLDSDHGGNCVSIPTITIAVGRRLGYPIFQVNSKQHTYCRWDGTASGRNDHGNPAWSEKFNFDPSGSAPGVSLDPDAFYQTWPEITTPEEVAKFDLFSSLTAQKQLALFLLNRGHILKKAGRLHEALACYDQARSRWPETRIPAFFYDNTYAALYGTRPEAGVEAVLARQDQRLRAMDIQYINEMNRRNHQRIYGNMPGYVPLPPIYYPSNPNGDPFQQSEQTPLY